MGGQRRVQHLTVHSERTGSLRGFFKQDHGISDKPEITFRLLGDLLGQRQGNFQPGGLHGVQGHFGGRYGAEVKIPRQNRGLETR